jgi:endonuclease/exonuclease/phosphatase family metal-dependent hydrolase
MRGSPSKIEWAGRRRLRFAIALFLMLVAPAAGSVSMPASAGAKVPARSSAADGLSVMSYNVEGLPPPARLGRAASLARIGDRLADLRRQGRQPDVVLLQEAFSAPAKGIAEQAGYRYVADGPSAGATNLAPPPSDTLAFVREASRLDGEGDGKWADSGLRILSDYPIVKIRRMAFPAWACAGYDCLANKGALIAWIAVPGSLRPIAFIDTHLNSRAASGVAKSRADQAYAYQVSFLRRFVDANVGNDSPAILGGDFNSGKAATRWADLRGGVLARGRNSLIDAFRRNGVIPAPERGNAQAILKRAKDWLYYRGGGRQAIALTAFTVPFGAQRDRAMLSDHMGYEVRYRLGRSIPL